MAEDPFAQMAPGGTPKRGLRAQFDTGRVVTGLVMIGAVTFGLAYYMPLSSAHSALAAEHEKLSSSNTGTNEQLEKTTQQLMTTQQERDELSAKLKAIDEAKAAGSQGREALVERVKGKLAQLAKSSLVSVQATDTGAEIAVDNLALFRGHEASVHPPGRKLLCAIGKALKDVEADVHVGGYTSGNKVTNPKLKKDYLTVWDASAARAVGALRVLESCGVPGKRMAAAGHAEHGVGELGGKQSDGQIRIRLTPLP